MYIGILYAGVAYNWQEKLYRVSLSILGCLQSTSIVTVLTTGFLKVYKVRRANAWNFLPLRCPPSLWLFVFVPASCALGFKLLLTACQLPYLHLGNGNIFTFRDLPCVQNIARLSGQESSVSSWASKTYFKAYLRTMVTHSWEREANQYYLRT